MGAVKDLWNDFYDDALDMGMSLWDADNYATEQTVARLSAAIDRADDRRNEMKERGE